MRPLVVTTAGAAFITSAMLNKEPVSKTIYDSSGVSVNSVTAQYQLKDLTTNNINPNQSYGFAKLGRGNRNPNYMDYNLANTSVSDEDPTDINTVITCQTARREIVNGIVNYVFIFTNTGNDTLNVKEIGYFANTGSAASPQSFLLMRGLLNGGTGFDIAPTQTLTVSLQFDPASAYVQP